jgi:hypothetical protein
MTEPLTPQNAASFMRRYGGIETHPISTVESGVKMGFFGPGGGGKTTLVGTAVESEYGSPMLLMNARGNPEVIRSKGERIQVIDVKSYKEVAAIRKDLYNDPNCPFKSVAIDTVSELLSLDLRDRYGTSGKVEWQQHAASTADILGMLRDWVDIADWGPRLNVFFVFWDTPEKRTINGREIDRMELQLNKALQAQAPGLVNWLGRVYVAEGEPRYTRCLDFRPIETIHVAKHQIDPEDPHARQIPMRIYSPHLGHILDTIKGGKDFPIAQHTLRTPRGEGAKESEADDAS